MAVSGASFYYFVLGLLDRQPMSGYDIKRLLQRLKGLFGSSSFGNIYPTLHTLLKEGWATVEVLTREDRPPKKVYAITPEGRQSLRQWLEGPVPANLSQRALVMRLVLARDSEQGGLMAHLDQRRAHVVSHRDALLELRSESEHSDVGWQLALDYGLAAADAELAWLDRALEPASRESQLEEVVEAAYPADAG